MSTAFASTALHRYSRGYAQRHYRDAGSSVEDYTEALKRRPAHFKALVNRGFSYDMLGKHTLAIKDFDSALKIQANSPHVLYNRGIAHFNVGDFHAALNDFSKAIEIEQENQGQASSDLYHNRSLCYRTMGTNEHSRPILFCVCSRMAHHVPTAFTDTEEWLAGHNSPD